MSILDQLLGAYADNAPEGRDEALLELLNSAEANLADIRSDALARFKELNEGQHTDEALDAMEALAAVAKAVQTRIHERAASDQARSDRAAQLANDVAALSKNDDELQESSQIAPAEGNAEPHAEEAAESKPPALIADAQPKTAWAHVDFSRMPSSAVPAQSKPTYTVNAAADIPGVPAGAELDGVRGIATAMTARMSAISRVGPGKTVQAGLAAIQRNRSAALTAENENDFQAVLHAINETRLPGGTLLAAGGWCSPSETIYDLCAPASTDGLVDIPEITARRGGVRFPAGNDFSAIYGGGFHQTEAQAIAGTTKPCIDIACPTFTEVRLDIDGICLRAPILTERAYPELVASFVADALAAHVHRINAFKLSRMVALATANTITPNPNFGAETTALEYIEHQAEWIRYRHRLSLNSTMELVAPAWLRGALRADLAKKNGVDLFSVDDARLAEYFRARKLRVQWVYDWQDALATGTATDFGGATLQDDWPANATVLIYPAGTYFALTADVITLDGIYDSTGLSTNVFTRLFTEEGVNVAKQCYTAIALTFPVCTSGGSGIQLEAACAITP